MGETFQPECLESCPQLHACAARAVIQATQTGESIHETFLAVANAAIESGELPVYCETGPQEVKLVENPSNDPRHSHSEIAKASQSVVTGITPWGKTVLRVCQADIKK